jgi:hypothetical protein
MATMCTSFDWEGVISMSNNQMGGLGDLLGSLFGQGTRQEDIQRFDDTYQRGRAEDFDDYEVQQRYRQTLRNAPPQVVEDAHADAFAQLSPDQRREMARRLRAQAAQLEQPYDDPYDYDNDDDEDPRKLARMAQQAEQRNPNVLDQLFGGQPGPLNNPMVKMAIAGAAAMAARRFLSGNQGAMGGIGGASPMGGLGSLLGGQQTNDAPQPRPRKRFDGSEV